MQFLDLTSGLRVAVFVAVNDWFWPNFPVRGRARGWVVRYRKRQLSSRKRYYRKLLCESSLTGGRRLKANISTGVAKCVHKKASA